MSSAICQNFVQNAWKKELCSNCFKSKDEHAQKVIQLKPIVLISTKMPESIMMKTAPSKAAKKKARKSVVFRKELQEIIGYGGENWSDSDGENENPESASNSDESEESDGDFPAQSDDEERAKQLRRLTKQNTDYNALALKETEQNNNNSKKSYAQLLLGKPLIDAEGRRQTLLVQVTPFGGEDSTPRRIAAKSFSHIPIASKSTSLAEAKNTGVVLTSYNKKNAEGEESTSPKAAAAEKSLLDEISETLEKSNQIQIISPRKKTQKEIILAACDKAETVKNKVGEVRGEKRSSLTRTPALKRDEADKPVITSTAKIELCAAKTLKIALQNEAGTGEVHDQLGEKTEPPFRGSLTREQAGEPDGRADPEVPAEPPALPLTPPPALETQNSFLHAADKPKIASKPSTVLIRKPINNNSAPSNNSAFKVLSSFAPDAAKLAKRDSDASDLSAKIANKRRAPKPPEEAACPLQTKQSVPPVLREKERRERVFVCGNPRGGSDELANHPEPAPRKSLSLSSENLHGAKDKSKGRFSLKKFLRMGGGGSNKDLPKLASTEEIVLEAGPPQPKPRLVIVHPSELNGDKVEVVAAKADVFVADYANLPGDYEAISPSPKAAKPPPPPRNLEEWKSSPKPGLPPPPKSADVVSKQKTQVGRNGVNNRKMETVYANIGEVRSAIVPNKPVRTASMREREAQQQMRKLSDSYEPIELNNKGDQPMGEHLYDFIPSTSRSSTPESPEKSPNSKAFRLLNKRSESSIDVSGDYFKFNNIPRSMSLTYCGSETESEIYAPYSFYGSESEVTEDDHDWIQNGRTHKLRSRKGRSIVHKNLEDNYGAVIVANHEALAQVLENIQQTVHVQPALRGLKTLSNLRWTDFALVTSSPAVKVGRRIFYQALWGAQHVTLAVSCGSAPASTHALGNLSLVPVTEFSDLIPNTHLTFADDKDGPVQASIAVLPWTHVETIETYSQTLQSKTSTAQEDLWKETSFVMLQLVNALKTLQAQGIEELPLALTSFVLCKEPEKDSQHYRLHFLQEEIPPENKEYGSLCACALRAQRFLLFRADAKVSGLVESLLSNERAVSLTQAKSVLEFWLWGPRDVALGCTLRERETALQRWLDLQRATVLHGLVCARVQLTVREEFHLLFFVRSNAKAMSEASVLLEASNANANKGARKC